jgi:tRNA nucleotidyltransferase (CCA-adding enzyme)
MKNLPEERLRLELEKSLVEADKPRRFFDVLDEIGALETTLPEIADLRDTPAGPEQYHKEGSAYAHTMKVVQEMKDRRPNDELALLMALAHDMGKAATDESQLPNHPDHGTAGIGIIRRMAQRLGMSNEQRDAMLDASRLHMQVSDFDKLRESTVIEMVQQTDNIPRLLDLAAADAAGREPAGNFDKRAAAMRFGAAQNSIDEWTGQRLIEEGYDPDEMGGKEFGDLLRQKRVELMRDVEAEI